MDTQTLAHFALIQTEGATLQPTVLSYVEKFIMTLLVDMDGVVLSSDLQG